MVKSVLATGFVFLFVSILGALPGPAPAQDVPAAPYAYAGREADASGLIYYRARYYDPACGRFSQRDPLGLAAGIDDYAYVGDNPANRVDPSGLAASDVDADGAKAQAYSGMRYWDSYSDRWIGPQARAQAARDAAVPWWQVPRILASAIVFGQAFAEAFPALLVEERLTHATRLSGDVAEAGSAGATLARWLFRGDSRPWARILDAGGFTPFERNLEFQRVQLQAPKLQIPFVSTSPDREIALGYAYGFSRGFRFRGYLYTIERPPLSIDLYEYYEAMGIPREMVHAVIQEPEVLIPNAPLSYIRSWQPVGYDGRFMGPEELNPLYGTHLPPGR